MVKVWIRPHLARRGIKKVRVSGHYREMPSSREKGRSGKKFKRLERRVYNEYRKKGYSKSRSRQIAKATAGKVFWHKYGKKSGKRILKRER